MMRTSALSLSLVAGLLLLAGCDIGSFGDSNRFQEDFHSSYPLKPGGRVSVETFNGSVEVLGWEKDSVEISGTKHAATKILLDSMRIDVVASTDTVRIRVARGSERHGSAGARFVLRVPFKTELDRVESSNGSLRVESTQGAARLRTSNGSVRASRIEGGIDATTTNGSIELADSSGPAMLRTSNGSIGVSGVRGALEASTSNGRIRAQLADIPAGRPIKASTINGGIELTLDSIRDNDVRASTSNGAIALRVPASTSARVRAQTSNSSVSTDFEIRMKGVLSKNHMEGTIGDGGSMFDLSTSNGAIKILKR
jgi:DUF4097 and DUF4098 domain-containing protein YvlB